MFRYLLEMYKQEATKMEKQTILESTKRAEKILTQRLIQELETVGQRLIQDAKSIKFDLERDGRVVINSCGIVQTQGVQIDRMCTQLGTLRDVISELEVPQ